jgi:hypothetical protein
MSSGYCLLLLVYALFSFFLSSLYERFLKYTEDFQFGCVANPDLLW